MRNLAREMITTAVNSAIARGGQPIVEVPTLACLRERARDAWGGFVAECERSGYPDQWAAYRAHDAGQEWPEPLESAWQASSAATHAFYSARDGAGGFLGSRGL